MTIGTVNEIGRSQAGKPKVKIDGKWYFAGKCSIEGLQSGTRIDYQSNSFTTDSGKELWGLQSWKPVSGPPAANAVSDDAEMRFISNVVGSAITAGTLKDPTEVTKWAIAAKGALAALRSKNAPDPEFNDDLPERFYGNGSQQGQEEPGW